KILQVITDRRLHRCFAADHDRRLTWIVLAEEENVAAVGDSPALGVPEEPPKLRGRETGAVATGRAVVKPIQHEGARAAGDIGHRRAQEVVSIAKTDPRVDAGR